MIVDTSALMAVVKAEPDADRYTTALARHGGRLSVATWLEATIVASSNVPSLLEPLDEVIRATELRLEPVTAEQARAARAAHLRYGRRSGSPARLTYGDCFAYALAVTSGEPLLFKGEDFAHTDVEPALG